MTYAEISKRDLGAILYDKEGNLLYHPLYDVDESKLSKIDRLGLAYCQLNSWEWDDYIGPKPEGFDQLPNYDKNELKRIRHPLLMKILAKINPAKYAPIKTKSDFIDIVIQNIEEEIGEANTSRCHWVYGMKRTEEEWREWYYRNRHIKLSYNAK